MKERVGAVNQGGSSNFPSMGNFDTKINKTFAVNSVPANNNLNTTGVYPSNLHSHKVSQDKQDDLTKIVEKLVSKHSDKILSKNSSTTNVGKETFHSTTNYLSSYTNIAKKPNEHTHRPNEIFQATRKIIQEQQNENLGVREESKRPLASSKEFDNQAAIIKNSATSKLLSQDNTVQQILNRDNLFKNARDMINKPKTSEMIEKHIRSIQNLKQSTIRESISRTINAAHALDKNKKDDGEQPSVQEIPVDLDTKELAININPLKQVVSSKIEINIPSSKYFDPNGQHITRIDPSSFDAIPRGQSQTMIVDSDPKSFPASASKRSNLLNKSPKDKEAYSISKDYLPKSTTAAGLKQACLFSSKSFSDINNPNSLRKHQFAEEMQVPLRDSLEIEFDHGDNPPTKYVPKVPEISPNQISVTSVHNAVNKENATGPSPREVFETNPNHSNSNRKKVTSPTNDPYISKYESKYSKPDGKHSRLADRNELKRYQESSFTNTVGNRYSPQGLLSLLDNKDSKEVQQKKESGMPLSTTAADRSKQAIGLPYQRRLSRECYQQGQDALNGSMRRTNYVFESDKQQRADSRAEIEIMDNMNPAQKVFDQQDPASIYSTKVEKSSEAQVSSSSNIGSKFVASQGQPYLKGKYDNYLQSKKDTPSVLNITQKKSYIESTLGITKPSRAILSANTGSSIIGGALQEHRIRGQTFSASGNRPPHQFSGIADRKKVSLGTTNGGDLIVKRPIGISVMDQLRWGIKFP